MNEDTKNPADHGAAVETSQAEPGGSDAEAEEPFNTGEQIYQQWLASQPLEFHGVIARHGREAFEIGFETWQLGAALAVLGGTLSEGLTHLANESARTRKVAQALGQQGQMAFGVVSKLCDQLAHRARGELEPEKLLEIHQELQMAAQLAQAGRGQSGLVIARH